MWGEKFIRIKNMITEMADEIKKLDDLKNEDLADAISSRIKSITNIIREINLNTQRFIEEFDRREELYRKKRELYESNKTSYRHI